MILFELRCVVEETNKYWPHTWFSLSKTGMAASKSKETGSQWAWVLSGSRCAVDLACLISTAILALSSCEMGGDCTAVKRPLDMKLLLSFRLCLTSPDFLWGRLDRYGIFKVSWKHIDMEGWCIFLSKISFRCVKKIKTSTEETFKIIALVNSEATEDSPWVSKRQP